MSDLMLLSVLRMPYDMAMHSDISRYQLHSTCQEAAQRIESDAATIARLTRERDEALAKVAAAWNAAERALEARKFGDPDEHAEYAFDAALDRGIVAIRALAAADPDATAALNRVQAGAMREAAGINVARTGRDWVAGSLWDRIAQDHRSAILARSDAVERGE